MKFLASLAAFGFLIVLYSCCIVAGEYDRKEDERLRNLLNPKEEPDDQ